MIRATTDLFVETDNEEGNLGIVVMRACEMLRQMAINAGESSDIIVTNVKNQTGDGDTIL